MRRITILSLLAVTLFGGVASADHGRGRGRGGAGRAPGGVVVRDHRTYDRRPQRVRVQQPRRVRYERRPVYVNNGRFVFSGGVTRTYRRPVIQYRYYNYRVRPQIVVENYDPVPGYIWVAGSWSWNGREWMWTNGYYAPDPSYTQESYGYDTDGDGYADDFNNDGYPDNY